MLARIPHEKEISHPLIFVADLLGLTTSTVLLLHCSGRPTESGILGDTVHDTIPGPGLRLHKLELEEISGD